MINKMICDESFRDEVVALCRAMIAEESVSGQEKGVVDVLKAYYEKHRLGELAVDRYGSLTVTIQGDKPGPVVLFDGHIDTVPVTNPEKWEHSPYAGDICDGKLYGRGTSDMKGAISAMVVASRRFAEKTKGSFAGKIVIAGVVQEECFEGVSARIISERCQPDLVVIGEATHLNLAIGQRGRAEIKLESFGRSAHSASPHKGINAVYSMMEMIPQFRQVDLVEHPILGHGILELTDVISSPYPGASVIPNYCVATFDRRLLPGETPNSVLAPLKVLLDEAKRDNDQMDLSVSFAYGSERCYTGQMIEAERFFPGWIYDANEPFVQKALEALRKAGLPSTLSTYQFCTNGSHYAGEASIATIGIGPSLETLAHIDNEYIELEQLFGAVIAYEALMDCFCSAD